MRHAARTQPLPDFVVYGLLRLTSFRICKMSERVSRWAFVISCFLDFLCQFSAALFPKSWKMRPSRVPESIKRHSKWDTRALRAPLATKRFQGRTRGSVGHIFFQFESATWSILGHILAPTGFWRGSPKWVFSKQVNIQWGKWCPTRGFSKNMIFRSLFDAKLGDLNL